MCRMDLTVRIAVCRHAAKIPNCDTATRHVLRHLSSMTGIPDRSRSIFPRSGRIFEAWLTSMLREGWRLTEIAANRQRESHLGNQRYY